MENVILQNAIYKREDLNQNLEEGLKEEIMNEEMVKEEVIKTGTKARKDLKDQLVQVRKNTGMNRREFAEYFGIPYRTLQDWELGNRHMPEYLYQLIVYKVEKENLHK